MKTIKYGILGCGEHALLSHALPGKEIAGLELVALCDLDEARLNKFESECGLSLAKYTQQEKFLDSGIDAVLIATPDEYHFAGLDAAISRRLHIFVEKPVCTTESDLANLPKLLQKAQDTDLVVSSCHPRRFDPPYVWLEENMPRLLQQHGNVLDFMFDFSYHKPSRAWKHDRGLLLDHANHEIDLLHYYCGSAPFAAQKRHDTFDSYALAGVRADGTTFQFSGTRRLAERRFIESLQLRLERATLTLYSHSGRFSLHEHEHDTHTIVQVPKTDYGLRGMRTMIDWHDAMSGKNKPYLTKDDLIVNTSLSVVLSHHDSYAYGGKL